MGEIWWDGVGSGGSLLILNRLCELRIMVRKIKLQ